MSKAEELKTTSEIVQIILEQNPKARNSDDYLYIKVCEKVNNISINLPFKMVMSNRKAFGLPAFESVRRTRQKLQAAHPELAGDADVEAQRMLNEGVFKEYARGMV
jgi:hypothetical protein